MDGSNTVLIGTASVKARTIKRLPPDERSTGTLLDEALGNELTPRVGIRARVLQPHAAVPLPPLAPEIGQFAPDVPTQEQVVKQAVDH